MDGQSGTQEASRSVSIGADHDAPGEPAVIGVVLAAVLTIVLAQGSWQWFASYIGVMLLAVILSFYRLPRWKPGLGTAYMRYLTAFSLVVGLCVAITSAPSLQRSAWLFPMPDARRRCPEVGRYEGIQAEAVLANMVGRDRAALAHAKDAKIHQAVADCLSATTTLWLPAYGLGVAVLVGLGMWCFDWARARKEMAAADRNRPRQG